MPPILAFESISKRFGAVVIANGIDLALGDGEALGIIGPNGAGKTTLLDLICGKTKASADSIKFKNEELTKLTEHTRVRRGIGRNFQTPSIYENLTVFQNLEVSFPKGRSVLGALFFKCDDEVKARVQVVAEDVGLADALPMEAAVCDAVLQKLLQPLVTDVIEGHHDTLPILSTYPNASPSRVLTTHSKGNLWKSLGKHACQPACSWFSSYRTAVSL